MDTLVVGAGAMGRWLGRALRADAHDPVSLAFCDTDGTATREAAKALGARAVAPGDDDAFDAVCIAVPIPAASDAIAEHAPRAEQAIVDVTGWMAEPLTAMRTHAPECERASFHPLFAPENEPGNVPVVVDAPGPTVEVIRDALAARDNNLFETTAAEHDEAMETVQARTHAAVLAFGLAAEPVDPAFHTPVSAALADLVEQMAGGEPRVYADIQATFDGADDVADAAERIASADGEAFEALYRSLGGDGIDGDEADDEPRERDR
jgi:prephenate dehydrogenase